MNKRTLRVKSSTVVVLFVCLAFLVVTSATAQEQQFGEPLSNDATTTQVRLGELMENPEAYVDSRIRVAGLVDDVCPMKGCWIEILEKQSKTTVRFKVEDDVIVFPAEAKGQEVVAEGFLRSRELDEKAARAWFKHLADEKGEAFDESTVTGPTTIYEIEGIGATLGS